MKLKLDEQGHAVLVDGKPVYVSQDGKDYPMDVPSMYTKILDLTRESKENREGKEAAETTLKKFEGIEDVEAAKRALTTVRNLDEKKLVDAGKVEEIKAAAARAAEEQAAAAAKAHAAELDKVKGERDAIRSQYNTEKINGLFAASKFLSEKSAVPIDMVQATFSGRFSVEDGRVVATDFGGSKIYSNSKPGELAEFEEAIERIIDAYPNKNGILKGANQTGGGSQRTIGGDLPGEKKGNFGGSRDDRVAAIKSKFPDLSSVVVG